MEGSEIFLTITEWPLTAVATALVLIRQSANNFEIALETVPESTIIESTTMSEASASSPRCATSICPPFFFNSTALMLEEPTSRPTIVFDPIPNMCPPFRSAAVSPALLLLWPGSFRRRLRFTLCSRFHLARLLFHPLVQPRLLEPPAVAQLESGNTLLPDVFVQRVRTHSQVLRRLANVHHFSRVGHISLTLSSKLPASLVFDHRLVLGDALALYVCQRPFGVPSYYQPGKTPRPSESPVFAGFSMVFLERSRAVVGRLIYMR